MPFPVRVHEAARNQMVACGFDDPSGTLSLAPAPLADRAMARDCAGRCSVGCRAQSIRYLSVCSASETKICLFRHQATNRFACSTGAEDYRACNRAYFSVIAQQEAPTANVACSACSVWQASCLVVSAAAAGRYLTAA
jgi:hypothetical protein